MIFGELVGRVKSAIRFNFAMNSDVLFSVKGMTKGELMNISQSAPEVFALIEPILLECNHILMKKIMDNPKITPGEIIDDFSGRFNFIVDSVNAELKFRQKNN